MFTNRPMMNDIEKQIQKPPACRRPLLCNECALGINRMPTTFREWINREAYATNLPIRDDDMLLQSDIMTFEDKYGGPVIIDSYQDIQDFFCSWDSERIKNYLTVLFCAIGIIVIVMVMRRLPE